MWTVGRAPAGPVTVRFTAWPRVTDNRTPSGPRFDLRADPAGGLVGMGIGFLPRPADALAGDADWRVSLAFELPEDEDGGGGGARTSAASSLGDGSAPARARGRPDDLVSKCVVAVGPLQAWRDSRDGREIAVYWLGSPPYDMPRVATAAAMAIRSIDAFFVRAAGAASDFRVFVRQVENANGGTEAYAR